MVQSKKEIIDEQDFIKIRNFCSMKDTVKRIIWATDWEKMLTKDTGDKQLLSKMYQKLLKCSNKKTNHLIKKRKGNPLTLLVGMQTGTATMENSVEIS